MVEPEGRADSGTGCGAYRLREGIYRPASAISHRDDEYESLGFDILARMQSEHFWYLGRHRFLLRAVRRTLGHIPPDRPDRLIDFGGGCGGWLAYLAEDGRFRDATLALADSSERALRYASTILPDRVRSYQVDLLNLQFRNEWDAAFLLDVLEHIPDHEAALRQIQESLVPGGTLFVTVPALQAFWSWNDEVAHHQRRYRRKDFVTLARSTGFQLVDARYFMFFLSPLLFATRWLSRGGMRPEMTAEEKARLVAKTHATPSPIVNGALKAIFAAETPIGHLVKFPWGTSLLAILRKPSE